MQTGTRKVILDFFLNVMNTIRNEHVPRTIIRAIMAYTIAWSLYTTLADVIGWIRWTALTDIVLFVGVAMCADFLRNHGLRSLFFNISFSVVLAAYLLRGVFMPLHALDTLLGAVANCCLFTGILNLSVMAWRLSNVLEVTWTFDQFRRRETMTRLVDALALLVRGALYTAYFLATGWDSVGWVYATFKMFKIASALVDAWRDSDMPEFGPNHVHEGLLDPCPLCLDRVEGTLVTLSRCRHSYCASCIGALRLKSPKLALQCALCRRDSHLPVFLDELASIVPTSEFRFF